MARQMIAALFFGLILQNTSASANDDSSSSSTCDASCRAQTGASYEAHQHASVDFNFYQIPSNFSPTLLPGSLLHVEAVTNLSNYSVPSSLTMSRIIYTTTDLNGTILPASAYVLWPYIALETSSSKTSSNDNITSGYPLVAWAHGTSGLNRDCAPSNYRNLQYHFMVPFQLALQGMAVVAPDYAGLGFDELPSGQHFGHPWLAAPAQANDLRNAILAARTAFPTLLKPSGPFVAMGHSQGAQAVWSFAEQQANTTHPVAGYQGTVAIAPVTNMIHQLEVALNDTSLSWAPQALSTQPRLNAGITAAFPGYNYSGLTAVSYDRWVNHLDAVSGCFPTEALLFQDLPVAQLAKPGWTQHPTVKAYEKAAQAGRKRFEGPLLVLAGEIDQVVPLELLEQTVDETCGMMGKGEGGWGASLEMVTFSGVNHFPSVQASSIKWLAWVKERLGATGNASVPVGCRKSVVEGFRTQDTPDSISPNFLEQWRPRNESWQYFL